MTRYFARKTTCRHGHKHDSAREAARCNELHLLERGGEISRLKIAPRFDFVINGEPVKMRNGQTAGYTADFQYFEGDKSIVEDVKAKNGFVSRDVPLRFAIFQALYPYLELRVTT